LKDTETVKYTGNTDSKKIAKASFIIKVAHKMPEEFSVIENKTAYQINREFLSDSYRIETIKNLQCFFNHTIATDS
jgi:hypothetical protein